MNITVHREQDGTVRLTPAGNLDMATAGDLDQHVADVFAGESAHTLIVNASEVAFCDSSGIHALLRARETAHRYGAAFQLSSPTGITRRTLEVTGLLTPLTTLSTSEGSGHGSAAARP
ncbi:hypothetical protein Aab01nite_81270 [Paractinoplanes abujensis]|uniref:Anti-sigma factor antagonist n=1 Tax=Paractinoplanes abujensis TaxID=882441 RepID=A0A7W7CS44_9ACTN|nr:STAS domain-containing protein [Actinoplanes abujensis]MBB4693334.1 anti-sigma B factor antagonist [Actinoplanes abujensis]GID24537.1 hypothetical protein Aab01nite_81270 [Actinoplanes abujensis]